MSFIISAAFPLESKQVSNRKYHTAVGLAFCQCFGKLRPHIDIEMLRKIIFDSSCFHAFINHALDTSWVQREKDITDPLLVDMDPISWIWHESEQSGALSCKFEEICHSKPLNLWDCCNLNCIPLDILKGGFFNLEITLPLSSQT